MKSREREREEKKSRGKEKERGVENREIRKGNLSRKL